MTKKIAALAIFGLLAAAIALPASPAHAAPFAGAALCTTDLPEWPASAPQSAPDCVGTSVGAGLGVVCLPTCAFRATVEQYDEQCTLNEPPLIGTANGTMYVDPGSGEVEVGDYNWTRVGVAALVLPVSGATVAGVAAFVPSIPLGTCAAPARPFHVTVAGVAVGTAL